MVSRGVAGQNALCEIGLREQHRQSRDRGIPFDQRGSRSDDPQSHFEKRLHSGRDCPVMRVEQQRRHVGIGLAVAAKMELANGFDRQRAQILRGIPSMIRRADKDVVDVTNQAAASSRGEHGASGAQAATVR